jgi:hypothetical protein
MDDRGVLLVTHTIHTHVYLYCRKRTSTKVITIGITLGRGGPNINTRKTGVAIILLHVIVELPAVTSAEFREEGRSQKRRQWDVSDGDLGIWGPVGGDCVPGNGTTLSPGQREASRSELGSKLFGIAKATRTWRRFRWLGLITY